MGNIEKKKNLFIITLDEGKQNFFDFATNCWHGKNGKIVRTFNYEAKRILKKEQDKNFLAKFFLEIFK